MKRLIARGVIFAFLGNFCLLPQAQAQLTLPAPGQMVALSPPAQPAVLRGLKVFADKPLSFDFILDVGDGPRAVPQDVGRAQGPAPTDLRRESTKLIRYFLASLTVPEGDLWVNLSPYEKDRIVPDAFGQTEMGRDLLAQDYILKQVASSVIYPDSATGKEFWAKVYAQAQQRFGTTQVPVNTFNKVWIVPDKAIVYEGPIKNGQATAYVTQATLKVMLEEDYLALQKNSVIPAQAGIQNTNTLGSQIVREVVIPILAKEINEGANFAQLRQIYNSLILATWYKKKIKDGILSQQYTDQKKVSGITIDGPQDKEKIYQQYLQAFKKGAYNFIKEEQDPATGQTIPRKYFSGGAQFGDLALITSTVQPKDPGHAQIAHVDLAEPDRAMSAQKLWQLSDTVVSVHMLDVPQLMSGTADLMGKFRQKIALYHDYYRIPPGATPQVSEWGAYNPPEGTSSIFIGGALTKCLNNAIKFAANTAFEHGHKRFTAYVVAPLVWLMGDNGEEASPILEKALEEIDRDGRIWIFYGRDSLFLTRENYLSALFNVFHASSFSNDKFRVNSSVVVRINGQEHEIRKGLDGNTLVIDVVRKGDPRISDRAMSVPADPTGGIDLNPIDKQMQTQGAGEFHFTPSSLRDIRINGLVPVMTGIEELKSLPEFLGIH